MKQQEGEFPVETARGLLKDIDKIEINLSRGAEMIKAFVCLLPVLFMACAKITVTHVGTGDTSEGIHFVRPRPYLLVSSSPTKELKSEILWLPDYSQEYAIHIRPGVGRSNMNIKLKDGWMLTEMGGETDARFSEAATAFGNAFEAVKSASVDLAGLYRIDIDPKGNVKLVKQDWMNP